MRPPRPVGALVVLMLASCVAAHQDTTTLVPEHAEATWEEDALVEEKNFGDDLSNFAASAGQSAGDWGNTISDDATHSNGWDTLPPSISQKRQIPRRDFKFNQVSRDFCGGPPYKPTKKCSMEYQESMVMVSFPMIIWTLVVLLMGLLVLMGRYCCCCDGCGSGWCGGRLPSQGCCYGDLKEADDGYTPCSVQVYMCMVCLVFLLVTVGMFVGFMGNAQLSTGMSSLLNIAKDTPNTITKQVHGVQQELASIQSHAAAVNPHLSTSMFTQVTSGLAHIANATSGIGPMITKSLAPVHRYEADRSFYTYLSFWIPTLVTALGIVGVICPVINFLVIVPVVSLLTAVVFAVLAAHIPIAVVTADFCVGLDYGLKHPNATSPIDMMMTCPQQPPGTAAQMAGSMAYFQATTTNAACFILNTTLCPTPAVAYTDTNGGSATLLPVSCPKGGDGNDLPCNVHTIDTIMNKTVVRDFQWGCSALDGAGKLIAKQCQYQDKSAAETGCLAAFGNTNVRPCAPGGKDFRPVSLLECSTGCLMNATRKMAFQAVGNQALSLQFGGIYHKQLEPLMSCSFMRGAAVQLQRTLCHGVVNATDYMILALAIIGFSLFFGNFFYLGAHKRFHKGYSEENWPATRASFLGEDDPDGFTDGFRQFDEEGAETAGLLQGAPREAP